MNVFLYFTDILYKQCVGYSSIIKSIQYREHNTRNEEAVITIGERGMMCELE